MICHDYHSVILRLWSSRDLWKKGHRKIGFGLEIPGEISPLTVQIKSLKEGIVICNVDTVKCRENSIYRRT